MQQALLRENIGNIQMNRTIGWAFLFVCCCRSGVFGEVQKAEDAPRPLSPQQSAALLRLPDGFRIDLVASEPLIQEPSCITFDEQGRMFVTELHGYNVEGEIDVAKLNKTGELDTEVRRLRWEFIGGEVAEEAKHRQYGKIKLLTDTDGDGQMDKVDVWADDLPAAYGVIAARGGIIVVAAPDIVFLADRDGDGKPEVRERLFTGFKKREMERGINNPRWGLDNWIYVGAGGHGGTITGPHLEKSIELQHSDFRIKADGSAIEPVTGRVGTFGLALNEVGDRFPCSGGQPAIYALPMLHEALIRNPDVAMPSTNQSAANYNNGFRISEPHPWRVQRRANPEWIKFYGNRETDSNYFTGGCGGEIYNAALFPTEYHGNFFYCEPSLNIVHRCILKRDGAGYKARRAAGEEKREFLASKDQWFRPMNLRLGPDGALYIVDMYREIIEDYSAIPRFLQQQYGLEKGRDKGRIWRLLPKESKSKIVSVAESPVEDLIDDLGHANIEKRLTAQRLLVERRHEASESQYRTKTRALHRVVQGSASPLARVHALCVLAGLEELTDADIVEAIRSDDYRVRLQALRLNSTLSGPLADSERATAILAMGADDDEAVRLQLAITLGDIAADLAPVAARNPSGNPKSSKPSVALRKLATDFGDDRWLAAAILSSAKYDQSLNLRDVLINLNDKPSKVVREILYPLAKATARNQAFLGCLHTLQRVDEETQVACLQGFVDGVQREKITPLPRAYAEELSDLFFSTNARTRHLGIKLGATLLDEDHPRLLDILEFEQKFAMQDDKPIEDRVAAIETVGYGRTALLMQTASVLLNAKQPPAIRDAVINALANSEDPEAVDVLFQDWASYTPETRKLVLDRTLSKKAIRHKVINAIKTGQIDSNHVTDSQREHLFRTSTEFDVEHLRKAWPAVTKPGAVELVERMKEYSAALVEKRNIDNGKKVFEETCAACHKLNDTGYEVGPPLGSVINKPDEAILFDILDPSSKIDSEYTSYVVVTEQGTSFTGVLASESATSITLRLEKGRAETILRKDIELLKASDVSLMPSDLHKQIPPQSMADLLAYLRRAYSEKR